MSHLNINETLAKINELRAVFVLGQRAVPFLEEVFYFLKEITPLMDDINSSIRESTHSMPRAASQLQSVSQANELATTEILDLVDMVLDKLNAVKGISRRHQEEIARLQEGYSEINSLLETELGQSHPGLRAAVASILERNINIQKSFSEGIVEQTSEIDEIRSKMNRIMNALQVQDITSQQLAAVNHLIESVRRRLARLVERLGSGALDQLPGIEMPKMGTFDPNAVYDRSEHRQAQVNSITDAFGSGRQDEIDQMFSAAPASVSNDDISALFSGAGSPGTPTNQDDIDQLFGNGGSSPVAADDIDKLFGAPTASPVDPGDIDKLFAPVQEKTSQSEIDDLFGASTQAASQDDIDALFKNGI